MESGAIDLSLKSYHWMIIGGIVPAVLAVLVLLIFVYERVTSKTGNTILHFPIKALRSGFDTRFKVFLAIMAIFTLGVAFPVNSISSHLYKV
jgi:hypothetical protein